MQCNLGTQAHELCVPPKKQAAFVDLAGNSAQIKSKAAKSADSSRYPKAQTGDP